MPVCAACGQDNPEIARFCLSCGAPMAVHEVRRERKVVTVLFAPVASIGGFTGRETVLTNAYLAKLISSNEARYFLRGGGGGFGAGGPGGGSNAAIQTIESTCTTVSAVSGLYDCAGKADAILASG